MEVILKEDFPSLGYVGDRVSVKAGYARNFLVPRGIALESSTRNAKLLKHQMQGINSKKIRRKAEADEYARKLQEVNLEFTLKVGEHGKSFGSVTTRNIEQAFKEAGHDIDRRQLSLSEPIKGAGKYSVHVKLHSEVSIALELLVKADKVAADSAKKKEKKEKQEAVEETETEESSAE
jgi:large subunit ribosomal protein L9